MAYVATRGGEKAIEQAERLWYLSLHMEDFAYAICTCEFLIAAV